MVEQAAEASACPRVQGGESLLQKKLPLFESRCFSLAGAPLGAPPPALGQGPRGGFPAARMFRGEARGPGESRWL